LTCTAVAPRVHGSKLKILPMKLGLGLHRHMLTRENLTFARQVGATHLVAHLAAETRAVAPTDPLPPPTPKDS